MKVIIHICQSGRPYDVVVTDVKHCQLEMQLF